MNAFFHTIIIPIFFFYCSSKYLKPIQHFWTMDKNYKRCLQYELGNHPVVINIYQLKQKKRSSKQYIYFTY